MSVTASFLAFVHPSSLRLGTSHHGCWNTDFLGVRTTSFSSSWILTSDLWSLTAARSPFLSPAVFTPPDLHESPSWSPSPCWVPSRPFCYQTSCNEHRSPLLPPYRWPAHALVRSPLFHQSYDIVLLLYPIPSLLHPLVYFAQAQSPNVSASRISCPSHSFPLSCPR